MRIVLDTNVLGLGLLSPFHAPGEIVRMVASGCLELCYDARILCEYQDVLARDKFCFDAAHVEDLIEQIRFCGKIPQSRPLPTSLPDPNDEPFLEVAIGGDVEYLVTGNVSHYPPEIRQGIEIVTPADFLHAYRKRAS